MVVQGSDPAASTATAAMLEADALTVGRVDAAGDRDWFAVDLRAGVTYRVTMEGIGSAPLALPTIVLRNAFGTEIVASRDADPAFLEFTPFVSGTYYVDAGARGDGTGRYGLAISDGTRDEATAGDDTIVATGPGESVAPGLGDDIVHGFETVALRGLDGGGFDVLRYDGIAYALDRADGSTDTMVAVESLAAHGVTLDLSARADFAALAYAASHDDLATTLRADPEAAVRQYVETGFFEGREVTFDAGQYLANWSDLAAAFGTDGGAATLHFLRLGVDEGRLAEDPLDYVASFADLIAAFGGQDQNALTANGLAHYQGAGQGEGRRPGIDFDAEQYLANHGDLAAAFGTDDDAAAVHYINFGFSEGRLAADPLDYVASHADLTAAFGDGDEAAIRQSGLSHWQSSGRNEARATDAFDADAYLANYADLRAAFAQPDGSYDEAAATLHYIRMGYDEGRTDDLQPV